jgi:CheY-like chemotaxis protein
MNIMLPVANCPTSAYEADQIRAPEQEGGTGGLGRDPASSSRRTMSDCKGRILLVDDDATVRETMAELLEDVGFNPFQAADAAEALTILRQQRDIDALVTDLTMPGDDGIALIRQARDIKADLPAILLTGYAEEVTAVATIAGGNFHVLRKPVESDRLIEQLVLLVSRPGA